ncbi:Na-H exchanger [Dictyostelium discoideum AX4]|uniref:Sodium/hydrogen exchanger 1 n=1 Tax=Dictyostelium discoideum TaxID=44689 RepID=NHE1_DICDI|nr:Na-H exchanger [Dictyostelium discoideum AX4]Q552S0.1 RecName: Full=Sodium/hydrogen exchanger 1; Short=DdNHE1; Short=NHE1; Short=Na-H exchanger 1; Flags: Precursor [Dictyostelium discoideum]EAL69606.1 Na-H exchanger [Dictyostelium discoideum AX4]|eukprot:XP_643611.1 Na-H exchanger [Dictyostelium discoideum AX4]
MKLNKSYILIVVLLLSLFYSSVSSTKTTLIKSNNHYNSDNSNNDNKNININNNNDGDGDDDDDNNKILITPENQNHLIHDIGIDSSSTEILFGSSSNSGSCGEKNNTKQNALANQREANTIIFIIMLILTGSVLIVYFIISLDIPFVPESVAVVTYGIILGIVFRFFYSDIVNHVVSFEPENFFLFILPTIIFETGYSLHKTDFFNNIGPILMFAVFGTIITFLVVGFGIYIVGYFGVSIALSLKDSFAFGSIISSTDPVCTLAIFQALNVDPMLYILVLGESILNDATSMMLYSVVEDTSTRDIIISCAMFTVVAIGSVILGVVMALLLSLILKWINIGKFPALETIFMVMFSYMSYVLAGALDISGVLAVFFFGITLNQYGAYSLSPYTKLTSGQLFRTAAFISETFLFLYFGLSLTAHEFKFDLGLFSWSILFTCLARAISVFPMCFLLNKFLKTKIPWVIQVAIWFAGLRGAFAFSLSLDYISEDEHMNAYIRTNTLLVVVFTIFVFGMGTYPLLRVLGIKTSQTDQSLDNISKPMSKQTKQKDRTKLYESFDDKYFKPWFRKRVPPLANEAIEIFEKMVIQSSHDHELDSNPLRFDDDEEDDDDEDLDFDSDLDLNININTDSIHQSDNNNNDNGNNNNNNNNIIINNNSQHHSNDGSNNKNNDTLPLI